MQCLDSEHTAGVWDWDDFKKELFFTSTKQVEDSGDGTEQQVRRQVPGCTHAHLELVFSAAPDVAAFRRTCKRDRATGPDVVTLRDVKDVVLFSVASPLPSKLVDLLHTAQADRMLRAVILYMQFYLQTSAEIVTRESNMGGRMRVAEYPPTVRTEARMSADLAVMRSLVAKEYCSLLLGFGELHRYHHMANKLRKTMPEDDLRTHELLHQLAVQMAWVALGRRAQTQPLVASELGRLLRSSAFNVADHRCPAPSGSKLKNAVLAGPPPRYGRNQWKLLARSVATTDLLALRDYEIAGLGYLDVPVGRRSARARLLECALTAPEEALAGGEAAVGVLGHPLADFDDMLNLVKMSDDAAAEPRAGDKPTPATQSASGKEFRLKFASQQEFAPVEERPSIERQASGGGDGGDGGVGVETHTSVTEKIASLTEKVASVMEREASVSWRSSSVMTKQSSVVGQQSSSVTVGSKPSSTSGRHRRPSLTLKKAVEMPAEEVPIPPPDYFPTRKTPIGRGAVDLLEARAVWRNINRRKKMA